VSGLFSLIGAVPSGPRPTRGDIFGQVQVNYKLFLNVVGVAIFATLFAITFRRGAKDPNCGMKVDRGRAIVQQVDGHAYYFCSEHCRHEFMAGTESPRAEAAHVH
jgi:YHS domain-containing protein